MFGKNNLLTEEKIIKVGKVNKICLLLSIIPFIFSVIPFVVVFEYFKKHYHHSYRIMMKNLSHDTIKHIIFYFILFFFLPRFIRILFSIFRTRLTLTNKRIVAESGFIRKTHFDINLRVATNVYYSSNLLGKIFNYGTIYIETYERINRFRWIKNPNNFAFSASEEVYK